MPIRLSNHEKKADKCDFILSDGLKNFNEEADVLVIAGMGGLLISNIILNDYEKEIKFKKIIIDANIDRTNNVIIDSKKTNCSPDNIGKIIICTGCGAKNTFTGKVGQRCEYCGAVISEEMINENK